MKEFGSKKLVILCLMFVVRDINAAFDYCNISPDHLLCNVDCSNYVRIDSESCTEYQTVSFDSNWKEQVVIAHNMMRQAAVEGELKGREDKTFKTAKNMPKMMWDDLLECMSRVQADRCAGYTGSDKEQRTIENKTIGEVVLNLECDVWNYTAALFVMEFAPLFFAELKSFPVEYVDDFKSEGYENQSVTTVGQIIFSNSYQVGCSASSYKIEEKRYTTFVCHYGPVGVEEGDVLYESYVEGEGYCDNDEVEGPHLCDGNETITSSTDGNEIITSSTNGNEITTNSTGNGPLDLTGEGNRLKPNSSDPNTIILFLLYIVLLKFYI